MARVIFGGGVTSITGKLGGSVFQVGNGGHIIRNKGVPILSPNESVNISKAKFASIANAWTADTTITQRINWQTYGINHGIVGQGKHPSANSGRLAFNRVNRAIIDAGGEPILDPPIYIDVPQLLNPYLDVELSGPSIQLYFDNASILPPMVLSIRATQPYLPSNIFAANSCTFVGNFSPAYSPVDFTTEWFKAHGAWNLQPGVVIYCEPYIVESLSGFISAPIKISGTAH